MHIDGVFSGGGIKAFAFVGVYQVLEERHVIFKRVAGTSAGAIMAAFIIAGYKAKEIEELLDELDLSALLDARKTLLPNPLMKWLNVYKYLGLYKGKALEKWFREKLSLKGIYTFADIPVGSLKIIASDLTNGKMLTIPDDLVNYGIHSNDFSVAHALRMSCSIPYFFEPVTLKSERGEAIIVDGGVLSNFPLWTFDDEKRLRIRPVLGVKLSSRVEEQCPRKIDNGLNLFEALFSTMKNAHDQRYISRRHEKDILFIPTEEQSATAFGIDHEEKQHLIQLGRERTERFLKHWPKVRL